MKIRAAVFREHTPSIEELELTGPGPGEVLVRIVATGVCHTDLKTAAPGGWSPRPVVLGHEGSGVVEEVGAGVTRLAPGDHVVMSIGSCGRCPACLDAEPAYCHDHNHFACTRPDGEHCLSAGGQPVHGDFFNQSSFATHAIGKERGVVKVRKDAPLELVFPRMFDLSRERELVKAMRIVTCHLPDPAVKSEFGQRIAEMAAEYGVKVDAVKAARRPYLAIHRLFTELGASAREDMRLFGRNEPKHEAFRWFNEARERLLSGIFNLVMSVSQMRTNDLVELVRSGKMDEKTARGRLKYELHVAKARFSRRDVSNVEQAKSRFESAIRQAMPSATPSKGLRPAAPKPQQSTATADDRYRASLRANEPAPRRRPRRNRRPRHGATRRPTASK